MGTAEGQRLPSYEQAGVETKKWATACGMKNIFNLCPVQHTNTHTTMSTKHTPGPWYLEEHYLTVQVNDEEVDFHGNPIKFIIARANDTANARLIAAAPELLDICESILAKVAAAMPARHDDLTAVSVTFTGADLARLRAAIAKATGNTL